MSRRDNQRAAEDAAQRASEAGRVLQAQRQTQPEARNEPAAEPSAEPASSAPIKPRNEPRRQAMEEIEARHNKTSGMQQPEPETPPAAAPKAEEKKPEEKPSEAAPATPAAAEPAQAQPEAAAPAEQPAAAPEPAKTIRVKVDGEEFDAPAADVEAAGGVHAYQRDKASDNRLRKANEALAEAKRMQAAVTQWHQQQQAQQPPKLTDDQFITSKMDAVRYGTQEESAAALREIMDRSRVDPNAIVGRAVSAMQQQAAEAKFIEEFHDIVHNPVLIRTIMGMRDERVRQGNLTGDWNSFYRAIGNEVRSAIGRPSQPATSAAAPAAAQQSSGNPSQAPTEKEARKASIVTLPTAAARAALPAESKPETREDTLNQMRKSRGLPTG